MTLAAVKSPSNDTTPSFSGTASESLPVTVKAYKGAKPEGTVVATAEGPVSSDKWGPVSSSTALGNGTYTAEAEEPSSLGNTTGHSSPVTFVINTNAPEVTLNTVKTPSNDTTPAFSGTASESLPVTVKAYKGSKVEGVPVATAEASVSGGDWGPVSSLTTLASGTYTAVAEEESAIGNATGESSPITFVINTETARSDAEQRDVALEQHKTVVQGNRERIAGGDRQDLQRIESRRLPGRHGGRIGVGQNGGRPVPRPRSRAAPTQRWPKRKARLGTPRARAAPSRSSSTRARLK